MINNLSLIAAGSGIQDGLNPCMFMTSAVFIALGQSFKDRFLQMARLRLLFVFAYAVVFFVVSFGPGQVLVLQRPFIPLARMTYLILGAWAFAGGIFYLKDWYFIRRGMERPQPPVEKLSFGPACAVVLLTLFLAGVLSVASTLWPMDKYILILGNGAMLKGQGRQVMPVLASYIAASMWALWLVWLALSIKTIRPSMVKILSSAVFFTASSCMILYFK